MSPNWPENLRPTFLNQQFKILKETLKQCFSAIIKKGSKLYPGNYCPISVLPVISKLVKRIVHTQLYTYLNETGLLAFQLSGFRKNHST